MVDGFNDAYRHGRRVPFWLWGNDWNDCPPGYGEMTGAIVPFWLNGLSFMRARTDPSCDQLIGSCIHSTCLEAVRIRWLRSSGLCVTDVRTAHVTVPRDSDFFLYPQQLLNNNLRFAFDSLSSYYSRSRDVPDGFIDSNHDSDSKSLDFEYDKVSKSLSAMTNQLMTVVAAARRS